MRLERKDMEKQSDIFKKSIPFLIGILLFISFYLISLQSYLLFHSLAELSGIIVACCIFLLSYNARRMIDNHYLLFLGVFFLFCGILDLIHTLAYTGMGVFPEYGPNLPIQLWIAARMMGGISLLIAPVFIDRKLNYRLTITVYTVITALLLGSIYYWRVFPDCFIEGEGLTPFKIACEYGISFMLMAAIVALINKRSSFDPKVLRLLVASIALMVASEISFTLYTDLFGLANLVGHLLKIVYVFLVYKAIVETGVIKPHKLQFRTMKQNQNALRREVRQRRLVEQELLNTQMDLEEAVRQRTGELVEMNETLKQDISERKRMKLEKDKAVSELSLFIETANAPIMGIDRKGRINEWNRKASMITGFGKEEVFGHQLISEFIAMDYKAAVKEVLNNALRGMETANFEFPMFTKDGRRVELLLNAMTRRNMAGAIIGMIGVGQDITELTRHRDKLEQMVEERTNELILALMETEQGKDRIDTILKSVADGLIVTDPDKRIVLLNPAAEDLLDIRLSEVINRTVDFAVQDNTLKDRLSYTLNKKESGYEFDFSLKREKSSAEKILRARTSVIKGKKGKEGGMVTIIHDVTQEREMDRMKTEFISTSAHELRTPLTSIQGFSEILLTRPDLGDAEKVKYLGYINSKAVHLAGIINDLLDICRLEAGMGFSLNKQKHLASEVIQQAIDPFFNFSEKHPIDIEFKNKDVELVMDKEKIEQVLTNLLSNSIKYSPDGGTIRLSCEKLSDEYVISVSDEGMGMSPKQVEKVFDKFYRADASSSSIQGTGLGMAIVRYIVEAHEGKIRVESVEGEGTTVRFSIPFGSTFKHALKGISRDSSATFKDPGNISFPKSSCKQAGSPQDKSLSEEEVVK